MSKDLYYYCMPGETPRGPLPIQVIRSAVTAGHIPASVNLSLSPMGPWERLAAFDTSHRRKINARTSNKMFTVSMILVAIVLCGLCIWAIVVRTTDIKTEQPSPQAQKHYRPSSR